MPTEPPRGSLPPRRPTPTSATDLLSGTPRAELFRLAGIPIRIDATFALVPIFLFGILQQGTLANALPTFLAVVVGVFLSVLIHELGHALLARLFGVPVGEILVGGFYGYARMLGPAPSTVANVLILLAGPLANGLIFLGLWRLLGSPSIDLSGRFGYVEPSPLIAGTPWMIHTAFSLARINLAMLIFNLLPAFPLDGGRIYRDLLAAIIPRITAARVVAALGVIVGVWSAFAGLKVDIVLMLIGAEIAIINWAMLKRPEEA